MTALYISRLHFPITALGPGDRIGLWVQGCSIRCPGCISADTWAAKKGRTSVTAVRETMTGWIAKADGITISGGEPLDQARALEELLQQIRPQFAGDVLLFTGYPTDKTLAHPLIKTGFIDAVVPEPFDRAASQTLALRGGDNQPLVPLTALGRKRYANLIDAPPDRRLDVMFDETGVWFAGIPAPGDFARLEANLAANGHRITTSADRNRPFDSG